MTLHSLVIQKLLSTNAHLGRRAAAHHFKVYTYGFRNRMAIIDSDKTLICMRNACNFMASLVRQKGRFMFVNTNYLFDEIVEQMTKKIGCYSPTSNILWRMGGSLTNSGSPKKFRSRHKRLCFSPSQSPDCLVIMDTERKSSIIFEADRLQIPIVALVDSSMPLEYYNKISYPIPANDSVQFVYLFCNLITKTFLLEQKRFAAANAVTAKEEPSTPKAVKSEEVECIEQSKSRDDFAKIELLVVPFESLAPVPDGNSQIPSFSEFQPFHGRISVNADVAETRKLLDKLVVLKFNGALGKNMGFNGPKSTIEVCSGLTLLDLMANQIESLNTKYGCNIPLILMNTDDTNDDTVQALKGYSNIDVHSFLGNSGKDEGSSDHGVGFLSLMNSGTLDVLLSQGTEYLLVFSSDNATAFVDPKILNHLIQNKVECCMEVTPTASFDSKNSSSSSNLEKFQLGEIAQNSVKRATDEFKLVDTGNLWVDLRAIKRLVDTDTLKVDNHSTNKDSDSNQVQETAAGSVIRFFDHAIGIRVPQSSFLPVNTTSDLLLLQSDLYTCDKGIFVRNTKRTNPLNPLITLGPEFEKVRDFQIRFKSIPSIIELESLTATGDVWFGAGITLKGRVSIVAKPKMKLEIPDNVVLENEEINDPTDI